MEIKVWESPGNKRSRQWPDTEKTHPTKVKKGRNWGSYSKSNVSSKNNGALGSTYNQGDIQIVLTFTVGPFYVDSIGMSETEKGLQMLVWSNSLC